MEKKHTIGTFTAGLMVGLAILVDLLQGFFIISVLFLPFSIFLTFLSLSVFFLWFALMGVKYGGGDGGRKLLTMLAMSVVEIAPIINGLPGTTAGVLGIIIQTRIEDARRNRGGKTTPRTAAAAVRLERMRRSRQARESAARTERDSVEQERHPLDEAA